MRQTITLNQEQIQEAIKLLLDKNISPGYLKKFEEWTFEFERIENKVNCTAQTNIIERDES